MNEARIYEIRVEGHLGQEWAEWLDGMSIAMCKDGSTVLTGLVTDQAALHGLLLKLHNMGLSLISCNRVSSDPGEQETQAQ